MLLGTSEQHQPQTGAADCAKWHSFSIRSVLGDALRDDDDDEAEEDLDVVVDADVRSGGADRPTTTPGERPTPTDSSPGAGSSDAGSSDDMSPFEHHHNDDVHRTTDSSSLRSTDELRDFKRWTAFQATPNVIIASSQHPATLNSRYPNHGINIHCIT